MKSSEIVRFPITIRSHIQGGKLTGHYIHAGRMFPLGLPVIDKKQFVGVHRWLVITIGRPQEIDDLFKLTADLPQTPASDRIIWIGKVKLYFTKQGITAYLPLQIWNPGDIKFQEKIITSGFAETIYNHRNCPYTLVHVPLLTHSLMGRIWQ